MYPAYSFEERVADGTVHLIAVAASIAAGSTLITWSALSVGGWHVAAVSVYAATVMFSFVASLAYHFTPFEPWRATLRRIDHAAIFLKIAGTYTPLAFLINSAFAYSVLTGVWAVALAGMVIKIFFWTRPGAVSMGMYLALGWASVLLMWPLWDATPYPVVFLVMIGGLINSVGVYFFNQEDMRFSMAIWHAHVFVATVFYFTAIWIALAAGARV